MTLWTSEPEGWDVGKAEQRKPGTGGGSGADREHDARQRLALTRVLIWAEREASALERGDVADLLREAIATLHRDR